MSYQASLYVATFLIASAIMFVLIRLAKRNIQAREDELKHAAATRGWSFTAGTDRGYRVYTFKGTTNGVPWEAESAKLVSGSSKHGQRRHIARWHGQWSPGVSTPIVALGVPKGQEQMGQGVAQGDGLVAMLAQKAVGFAFDKALDMYFGKAIGDEIDAAALRRVESAQVPGFIVMAGNVDEASRILAEGLQRALIEATTTTGHVLSDTNRPYVLVRTKGISLARIDELRGVDDLERFVQAGVGLTRAFRFGQRA